MKVVALLSGGKDSCYAMMKCLQYGHQVVALANLMPEDDNVDELDSYMYQTVGHQIIVSYAHCTGLPLFRRRIQGSTRNQKLSYTRTQGDEVEDMFILLNEVKRRIPSVTAVSSGAIASDYQRLRVESICARLGLVSLAYLWKQDQSMLLREMITNGILAITVKVAAMGLQPEKHLGKDLAVLDAYLHKLKGLYGINVCGEGGEYETLTLDCPIFTNARIILDEFKVVLHSSDSIAPAGVLHPMAFHLENKAACVSVSGGYRINDVFHEKVGSVFEVCGHCLQICAATNQSVAEVDDILESAEHKLQISKTRKHNTFSICCSLDNSCETSADLQKDLKAVLKKIESQLALNGFGWENVLYIHLYIADMNEFSMVNETYVSFITHERCPFGVPSRSTVELPLSQVGLGGASIEVLVANDQSKRVLHVQSISSWAPSCIGPYSQATLHMEILHMAGQLGLDPPTMTLCDESSTAQLEQALENSEAVAKCFNCSISISAILFLVYCSDQIPSFERYEIQERQDTVLKKMRLLHLEEENVLSTLDPIFLYVLVPDLPKRALVEVKPLLHVPEDTEITAGTVQELPCTMSSSCWGLQQADWHESCIQKCIIHEKICAVVLNITREHVGKICYSDFLDPNHFRDGQTPLGEEQIDRVSRLCIYLLGKTLLENNFTWDDTLNWRVYFPTKLAISIETLTTSFIDSFNEIAGTSQSLKIDKEPIFNIIPVLGAGKSSTSMDDVITCELLARK